jgi:hypothetical protein
MLPRIEFVAGSISWDIRFLSSNNRSMYENDILRTRKDLFSETCAKRIVALKDNNILSIVAHEC